MKEQPLILLVDDDAYVRRFFGQQLKQAGYRVDEVESGDRALEAIRSLRPDLVLLDILMPGLNGLAVCARMRVDAEVGDTPVLFLSSADDIPTKAAGFQLGAHDFLSKTIDPRELEIRVKAALAAKLQRDALKEAAIRLRSEALRLQQEAQVDPLTGLPNRRALMEGGDRAMYLARYMEQPVSLYMIDVDHFKKVNDTWGHAAGDRILKQVATRIRANLREGDLCARFGGEEFSAVLPGANLGDAVGVAERIRQCIEAHRFSAGKEKVRVTVSVGIAAFPQDGATLEELLEVADQRLYAAKGSGRNRVMPSGKPEQPGAEVRGG